MPNKEKIQQLPKLTDEPAEWYLYSVLKYIEYGGDLNFPTCDYNARATIQKKWTRGIIFALNNLNSDHFQSAGKNSKYKDGSIRKRNKIPLVTIGAIIRSAQVRDRDKLSRFVEILKGKFKDISPKEHSAVLLHNHLQGINYNEILNNAKLRVDIYQKTEWAIDAFLQGKIVTKLGKCEQELYTVRPDCMRNGAFKGLMINAK